MSASDGKILSAYVEEAVNKDTSGESSSGQNQQTQDGTASGQNQQTQNGTGNADVAVSMDEAISIALERVPGATEKDVRIELDYDDGVYKYEGDIIHEQREYDFEIDANTGTILEWSEERA